MEKLNSLLEVRHDPISGFGVWRYTIRKQADSVMQRRCTASAMPEIVQILVSKPAHLNFTLVLLVQLNILSKFWQLP